MYQFNDAKLPIDNKFDQVYGNANSLQSSRESWNEMSNFIFEKLYRNNMSWIFYHIRICTRFNMCLFYIFVSYVTHINSKYNKMINITHWRYVILHHWGHPLDINKAINLFYLKQNKTINDLPIRQSQNPSIF